MQLKPAIISASDRLTAGHVPSPRLTAELLLMFTLACDLAYLFAHPERELSADETRHYDHALAERMRGVPTQYITGHQEFWGMDFLVSPAVLIPRPETEHLIETVLELIGVEKDGDNPGRADPIRIADVGTGSGCIAVALAKELPGAGIHAVDISEAALDVARTNAARHDVAARVHFHRADLLSGFQTDFFDFVVSNPPYVSTSEQEQLQPEVRDFEPHTALFAGSNGMDIIRRLVPEAYQALRPGGFLVMEIGSTLDAPVMELLGTWGGTSLKRDLQALPRVVFARKASAA